MLGMWEWHIVRGDLRVCADQAADGVALAERVNDPGVTMEALFMPGVTMFYRGQFAGARTHHENALAAYDDRARTKFWTAYTGHDAGVTHRCYLALDLWHLGYPDPALELAQETCELARTIRHPFSLGHAIDFAAYLSHYCRLGSEVQARGEEEVAVATEQGFPFWHALGTLHQGAGLLLQGRREEALPLLLKGFTAFRGSGAEVRLPSYLGMLGDAYTRMGRFEDAHKSLNEGLAVVEKNDDRCHEAELHRLRGELLLAESAAQASDGDNTASDNDKTAALLLNEILPVCQHYAYLEVGRDSEHFPPGFIRRDSDLWQTYSSIIANGAPMAMRKVGHRRDIYPVFRELFARKTGAEAATA
ncbi:MAG: DUF444 family protein [Rhodospirillales bacterium]|nr:DUF444 family protein [Rhodospirillales bacterium]